MSKYFESANLCTYLDFRIDNKPLVKKMFVYARDNNIDMGELLSLAVNNIMDMPPSRVVFMRDELRKRSGRIRVNTDFGVKK